MELKATKQFQIRFSEVDSMNIVWHGSYAKYFEDAREEFGRQFDLGYMLIYNSGCYAPLVDLSFHYKKPLTYEMQPEITITYRPTDAAKLVFDYEIHDTQSGELIATGQSVQVFMDMDYNLLWTCPEFFEKWKEKWLGK